MRRHNVRRSVLGVEQLESRYAPATLVNPTTLTYQDIDGDNVTVKISKPVFDGGSINSVFTFDTGTVNADNSVQQQLQLVDLTGLAAGGATLEVTAVPAGGGNGFVNVGYINATGLDLVKVHVAGDLGRIDAGDATTTTTGLGTLDVQSIGSVGIFTQAAFGNLNTTIQGRLGKLLVFGDLRGPIIHVVLGAVGKIDVFGSLIGVLGAGPDSGSIQVDGDLGVAIINGNIQGADGDGSGLLSVGALPKSVTVGGSLLGGLGQSSGRIGIKGHVGALTIAGDIKGGVGVDSGVVITSNSIATVSVGGSLLGGAGSSSGKISLGGAIGIVQISGDILGASGAGSGQISNGNGDISRVIVDGSIKSGTNSNAGSILCGNTLRSVVVHGDLIGTATFPVTIAARGQAKPTATKDLAMRRLVVDGKVEFTLIAAGRRENFIPKNADAQIGSISVGGDWIASSVAAGVVDGGNGFGNSGDALISGAGATDSPTIISKIKSITIGGTVDGSATAGDHFGFVAQEIQSVSIAGVALAITAGASNDNLALGTKGDFNLLEV